MCVCVCITSITKGEVDCCWPTYLQGQSAVWRQQWLSLFFTSDEIKLLFTTNKQGWREGRKQRTPTHTHMQTHTWEIKAVSDCCSLETRRQPKTVKKKSVTFLNVAVNRVFITENGQRVCERVYVFRESYVNVTWFFYLIFFSIGHLIGVNGLSDKWTNNQCGLCKLCTVTLVKRDSCLQLTLSQPPSPPCRWVKCW